jgi:multidrug efflux pump subunit AcrA (membrane-fusion protein)
LTENNPLEVRISVPLDRVPELHTGLPVDLINTQGRIVGRTNVFFISPNINNTSQSVLIIALYDNSDEQLRANQLIRAKVIWHQVQGVLIPTTSVAHIAGENFVFVAQKVKSPKGGTQLVAKQKPVKLGEIVGNNYQILAGLKPQEQIIVSGLLNLRDGLPIIPLAK